MLTFEQAKALKEGDIVYGDGFKCYVVKVTLNEKERSAEMIYEHEQIFQWCFGVS